MVFRYNERIKVQRATKVTEHKRKTKEKRKVAKFAKETEVERKAKEEENKKASELAVQMGATMEKEEVVIRECWTEIVTVVNTNKSTLSTDEIIRLRERMKLPKGTMENIESKKLIGRESLVGSQKTVMHGIVLKTVVINIINCKEMDFGSKGSLQAGIAQVNKLLRKEAITKNRTPSAAQAVDFDRKAGMESKWEVSRVQKEIKATEVLHSVIPCMIAFF